MGGFSRRRTRKAGTNAFPHDQFAACADGNAHLGAVEGGQLPALSLGPYAARRKRLPIPAVKTKNAVGLGDNVPALKVTDRGSLAGPGLDVLVFEFGRE